MNFARIPRGFTVLELMVAAAIATLIFGVGFYTITSTQLVQTQSAKSLRHAENARFFFEMLERDLATAYPAWFIESKTQLVVPNTPQYTDEPPATSDALQFISRIDSARTAPDAVYLVRYFVVQTDSLGRKISQVRRSIGIGYVRPNIGFNGATYDYNDVEMRDDVGSAIFDEVRSISFSFVRWDEATKRFVPSPESTSILQPNPVNPLDPANQEVKACTHLLVRLFINDDGRGNQSDAGIKLPRMYQKVIPLPGAFTQ